MIARLVASLVFVCIHGAALPVAAQDGPSLRERLAQRRAANAPPTTAPLPAGTHTLQVTHQGQKRTVVVHVPARSNPTQAAPLVLALHGGGGFADYMANGDRYGLIAKSDSAGFVVAFPNGYSKLPGGKFATWNAGAAVAMRATARWTTWAFCVPWWHS